MKKFFTLISFSLLLSITTKAQSTYFTEYFDNGATAITGTTANAATTPTVATIGTGDWTVYYAFRAGSGCTPNDPAVTSAKGLRVLQTSATTPAGLSTNANGPNAYIITPTLGFGVNVITWKNVSASATSRISVYKSSTNGTSWTAVQQNIDGTGAACGDYSVTVNDAAANKIKFQNESTTGVDLDNITITSVLTVTPVKFTSINALNTNGVNKVSWTNEVEVNTQSYIVERSTDGINYTSVGTLTATGANKYTWMDNASLNGNVLYRVKGLDKNGNATYSSIVTIGANLKAQELTVAPNPVKNGQLTLKMNNFSKGDYAVNIYNNAGQKVFTKVINNEGGVATQNLQLSSVNKGVYNLQLIGKSVNMTKRLIVE